VLSAAGSVNHLTATPRIRRELEHDLNGICELLRQPIVPEPEQPTPPTAWLSLQAAMAGREKVELSSLAHDKHPLAGPFAEEDTWKAVTQIRRKMRTSKIPATSILMMESASTPLPVGYVSAKTKTGLWQQVPVLFDTGGGICLLGQAATSLVDRKNVTQLKTPLPVKSAFSGDQNLHYYTMTTLRVGNDGKEAELMIQAYISPDYRGGVLFGINAMRQHTVSVLNEPDRTIDYQVCLSRMDAGH